jgi:uncharacterized membrane protein HdeD (DUF308 family)
MERAQNHGMNRGDEFSEPFTSNRILGGAIMSRVQSTGPFGSPFSFGAIRENLEDLRAHWAWFVVLGVALMILGMLAVIYSCVVSVVTVVVFGCFLIAAGLCYVVGAFFQHAWGGFFLSLLAGILSFAVGLIILNRPGESLLLYTLLLAAFFFVEGMFWIVGALAGRFRHWGWALFDGIITLILGILIWRQWPVAALYIIGLFIGINLLVTGASYIGMGLSARRLPIGAPRGPEGFGHPA